MAKGVGYKDNGNNHNIKIDDEIYYYLKDNKNRPIVTVCLLSSGQAYSRGIAVCSNMDQPCKRKGRQIAKGRAIQALKTGENTNAIKTLKAWEILNQTLFVTHWFYKVDITKSTFLPELMPYEKKIFTNKTIS